VWLNDALLQVYGDLGRGNDADYAKAPIYVPVPGRLLKQGDNHLQIRIRADSARRAGLSRVTIGPATPVRTELFESAYAWRFTGSVLLTAFSLIVGGIALALWLTQVDADAVGWHRREGIYFWAALAEFCWAIRVADGVIAEPPLSWGPWGVLMAACYAGWAASAMMFCYHLAGLGQQPAHALVALANGRRGGGTVGVQFAGAVPRRAVVAHRLARAGDRAIALFVCRLCRGHGAQAERGAACWWPPPRW
jgi:hypothetical protein